MLRRSAALAMAIATLGLAACGEGSSSTGGLSGAAERSGEQEPAESEALYVDLNGLKYQVQLSRQLNPKLAEDEDYFSQLASADSFLPKGSVWFGVFIRVENEYDEAIPAARTFSVEDTQGNEFEPVETENTFAYKPETVPGKGYIPNQESLGGYAGTQGSLLLFKIPNQSLDNRPLELIIKSPNDSRQTAIINLDV